jgi:hypothetical protein
MEALAAVGVAGNVLQFLDFGQKLVTTCTEIYLSTSGSLKANDDSEMLLREFAESIDNLSSDLSRYQDALNDTVQQVGGSPMKVTVDGCRSLAQDLIKRFERLRGEGNLGRWKSLVKGVKCMWKAKELQELQKRLTQHRSQLEWHVLIALR